MPGTDEVNEGESTKISLTFNWIFRGSWFHSASQWQSLLLSHGLMNIQGTLYIKIACNVSTFSWAKDVLTFWGKFIDSTDHVFIVLPAGDPDVSKTRKISSSPVFSPLFRWMLVFSPGPGCNFNDKDVGRPFLARDLLQHATQLRGWAICYALWRKYWAKVQEILMKGILQRNAEMYRETAKEIPRYCAVQSKYSPR